MDAALHNRRPTPRPGARNFPTNCQAQDISKYSFSLLRTIVRSWDQLTGWRHETACGATAHRVPGFSTAEKPAGASYCRPKRPLWNGLPMPADIGSGTGSANDG